MKRIIFTLLFAFIWYEIKQYQNRYVLRYTMSDGHHLMIAGRCYTK